MERIAVESSNIESIWYDNENLILEIEFIWWSVYQYFDVPENEYNWLMNADSHWKYLNENIKWVYEFNQIM